MPDLVRRPSDSGFHLNTAQQVIAAVAVLGIIAALLGYAFFFFVLIVPECLTALLWYTVYIASADNIPTAKPNVETIGCWTVVLGVLMFTAALIVITGHYTGRSIQDGDVAALIWFHIMSFGLQWAWFRYYGFKLRHPMTERDAKRRVQAKAEFLRQFNQTEWTVSMRETMLKAMDQVLKTPEDEWSHPFNLFTYAELKDLYDCLRDKVAAKPDPVKPEPKEPYQLIDPKQKTFYARPQDINPPPPKPGASSPEELRRIAIKEYERLRAVAEQWNSHVDIEVEMNRVSREDTRRQNPSKYDLAASEYPLLDNERLAQYAHLLHVLRDKVRYQGSTPPEPSVAPPSPADLQASRTRALEELNCLKMQHESDDEYELELEYKRVYREYSRNARNTRTGFAGWDASPSEYPLLDSERLHQYMDWLEVMKVRAKRGDTIARPDATLLGRTEAGERVLLPDSTRQDLSIIGGKQTGKSNAWNT